MGERLNRMGERLNKMGERLKKKLTPSNIIMILLLLALVAIIAAFIVALRATDFSSAVHENKMLRVEHFFSIPQWIQVIIAFFTLAVYAALLAQLALLKAQAIAQKEQAERELYRPLISPTLMAAKRILSADAVKSRISQLEGELRNLNDPSRELLQEMLDRFRKDIDQLATGMTFPLLDKPPGLDHIEALLNEYNYLSKLMLEYKLGRDFATASAKSNFRKYYHALRPFIELRERLTIDYASHFKELAKEPL